MPEVFQKLLDYASELSKSVIEDIEYFIEDYDKRINEAVNELEENSEKKNLKFTLTLRSPDMSKIDSEIHRLSSLLLTEINQSGLSWKRGYEKKNKIIEKNIFEIKKYQDQDI